MKTRDRQPMRYARPWTALLVTLALHLLLVLLVWQTGSRDGTRNTQASRLQVRLIAELAAKPPPSRSARPKPLKQLKQIESASASVAVQTHIAPSSVDTPALHSVAAASAPATSAASSAWTDDEQIRRIVQMHAKQVPITEQAALASQAPKKTTSTERLGQQIHSAANGDCLKGEFVGAGMGLLSLPFWAIAEARGKCRR